VTFTNSDLKRLKEETTHHGGGRCGVGCEYPLIDILGLLARLEAAERCLIPGTDYCVVCCCEDCQVNKEAWRRSCGEGE
jgi:hypothetical protein